MAADAQEADTLTDNMANLESKLGSAKAEVERLRHDRSHLLATVVNP